MLLRDARDYQILFLLLFLGLGLGTRDWTLHLEFMLTIGATCLVTQWLATTFFSKDKKANLNLSSPDFWTNSLQNFAKTSLRSALITTLGLCLLLRVDHYTTAILAASLAILSKFIFRIGDKHWFNPGNFGIIAALVLTNDAWVSPGQWGVDLWYALIFLGAGGIVLKRVGRWDTSIAFLSSYAVLEALRNLWLGWTWDVYMHRMMSGSLLLFALFMITDPRSIPNARVTRLIWSVAIAVLTFILRNQFYIADAVFFALFAMSPITVLLDWLKPDQIFTWQKNLDTSQALPIS